MSFVGDVNYVNGYLQETVAIASRIDPLVVGDLVDLLVATRDADGVVYVLGFGGSLANATHLAADLRRWGYLAEAPESLPELTALINDLGWDDVLVHWLARRFLKPHDTLLVLSVGGGHLDDGPSVPLARALVYARTFGCDIAGIVGEPGGYTAEIADVVVTIPTVHPDRKTEHCEGWQGIIHHLLVSHPRLRRTG